MQESNSAASPEGRPVEVTSAGPAGATSGGPARDPLADSRALQILSTEHWSLLATRSLAYNEAFSRASMFLSFLSATLIVIGFLAASIGPGPTMALVVVILLGVDLFIGLVTVGRLVEAGNEELGAIRGMNRIRNAYRSMVPGLEPYFVSGFHDDAAGVLATYGYRDPAAPTSSIRNILHGLGTTVGMIMTIVAATFGTLVAVIALGLGVDVAPSVALGSVAFIGASIVSSIVMGMAFLDQQARATVRFPSPPVDVGTAPTATTDDPGPPSGGPA